MAKFIFKAHFSSDPNEEYEIDDCEFMNLSEGERQEVIAKHHSDWIVDVAASEIEGSWEES